MRPHASGTSPEVPAAKTSEVAASWSGASGGFHGSSHMVSSSSYRKNNESFSQTPGTRMLKELA